MFLKRGDEVQNGSGRKGKVVALNFLDGKLVSCLVEHTDDPVTVRETMYYPIASLTKV